MAWSLLIRNGTVVDGSGAPARAADVAVEGDRIAAVGPGLAGEAARVIDAQGLMVAPGFIDIHSHSDLVYDKCPSAESKVRQGVTTEVVGMCSFSPAPVAPGRADLVQEWAGGIGGKIPITWNTFGEYLDHLRALGPTVNIVQFVGHGALRLAAVGAAARA
ncbi:MAG TPA: amidohydrolase family protein, partial [Candidatus Udaeobacter sp.]|nr:amidohydrolase family protein [Candidatus Udaeobacter sp.]